MRDRAVAAPGVDAAEATTTGGGEEESLATAQLSRPVAVARLRSAGTDRSRPLRLALWPAGILAGVAVLVPPLREDRLATTDLLYLLVGLSFIVSGLVGWGRRRENRLGLLMVVTGFLWYAAAILTQSSSELVVTLADWVGDGWIVTLALLLLSFPAGRLVTRLDRLLVGAFLLVMIPLEALWLLFLPPGDLPANAFVVWPNQQVADGIDGAQRVILLLSVAGVVVVLTRRWHRASPPLRRVLAPVLGGAGAMALFGAVIVIDWTERQLLIVTWVLLLVLLTVPLTFLAGLLRARLARSAVGDLLVELRDPPPHDALRDALARALHDPTVEVAYWVSEYQTYVGADGIPVRLPGDGEGRAVTLVERRRHRVAALIHDESLRDEPELVGAVGAAAGIALENERLQADLRARLQELRRSRARIVEAGDAERRRLERNLHDGAQQRLLTLSVRLGLVSSRLERDSATARLLAEAREDLAGSLDDLRELAQGIHPAVLSDHGLRVALESVAARAPFPVRLTVDVDGRLTEPVEVAAYYLVAEGLTNAAKYADAEVATVALVRENGRLVVEVADDGVGGADPVRGSGLRGLADRVESLGGRLRVWSAPGEGTTVRAELPCG